MTVQGFRIGRRDSRSGVSSGELEGGAAPQSEARLGTNIVLCSDGTGNSTIKNRGTNVYKLYEAVDIEPSPGNPRQIAFYDDGVGTGSLRFVRAFGGAFGFGFARNLRDLYQSLARVYRPGDSIYLFGFSRGAYTVRGLAGLITTCGIVPGSDLSERELRRAVNAAYRIYRLGYRPDNEVNRADAIARAEAFRKQHGVYEPGNPVRIAFIGVWDTVGAVGFPDGTWPKRILWVLSRYRVPWFKNYHLSHIVDHACHALAIDDERRTFHPELWDERVPANSRVPEDKRVLGRDNKERDARLEQVWFPGVHSNVGGGYPKQGMSLVTLHWMMRRASTAKLRFSQLDSHMYAERQNPHDKLYDSRRGLGAYYRYRPRDIGAICRGFGIENPRIHVSAIDRVALRTDGYAPGIIPKGSVVVGDGDDMRLRTLKDRVDSTLAAGLPLDSARGLAALRKAGYFISLITSLGLVGWLLCYGIRTQGLAFTAAAAVSVSGLVGLAWDLLLTHPVALPLVLLVLLGSWVTTSRARRAMHDRFADIWRKGVKELRRAPPTPAP
jgi:uncharacterized protein (DUF2235 family)